MEDDALGFDPITLIPKAQAANEPKIDLEAEVPKVKEIVSPKVENAVVPMVDEPTEEEIAVAENVPDIPEVPSEVESEQGLQTTVNFNGR
jgi:hypothetical protein